MRIRPLPLLLLCLSLFCFDYYASATQQMVSITSTSITDSAGNVLANGVIKFAPTDCNGNPLQYHIGGGGFAISRPVVAYVVNGAITTQVNGLPMKIVDTSATGPQNVCFDVTVTDTNAMYSFPTVHNVQPAANNSWCSSGVCDYGSYIPTITTLPLYGAGSTFTLSAATLSALGGVKAPNCAALGSNYFPQSLNSDGTWNCIQVSSSGVFTWPSAIPVGTTIPYSQITGVPTSSTVLMGGGTQAAGTLQAQITASGANATIVLPANYAESFTAPITVSASNVTIRCEIGATLTAPGSGSTAAITFSGIHQKLIGCTLNGNGNNGTTVLEVSGATNFTAEGNTVLNAPGSYPVRVDGGTNITFDASNVFPFLQVFGPTTGIKIANNFIGGVNVQSPAPGGSNLGFVLTGNVLSAQTGGTCATFGDFSTAKVSKEANWTVSGNTCYITGTTSGTSVFGGWSIVSGVIAGTFSGNATYADGQYLSYGGMELGCNGCTVTGNTFWLTDPASQAYHGIVSYGANNTIASNTVNGWGTTGNGIRIYPQTASGTALAAVSNLVEGNNLYSPTNTSAGIVLACNKSGSSAYNTSILGNLIAVGSTGQGVNAQDFAYATNGCPISVTIAGNTISGPTGTGIYLSGGTTSSATLGANYGATSLTVNNSIGVTASSSVIMGTATFTPTAAGWYRVYAQSTGGSVGGTVNIQQQYGSAVWNSWLDFYIGGYNTQSSLSLRNPALYAGGYGPIDQIEASNDNGSNVWLDVHVTTVASAAPITLVFYGQALVQSGVVVAPVVGATPGSYSVANISTSGFDTEETESFWTTGQITTAHLKLPNLLSKAGLATDASGHTQPQTAANVVSLFGSCSGIQYLGADGGCHAIGSGLAGVTQTGSGSTQTTAFAGAIGANTMLPTTYTVSTLPTGMTSGTVAMVSDGPSCTTGGGTTPTQCRYTGSAWAALGGTSGSNATTVNGASVPTSVPLASNSSGQLVTAVGTRLIAITSTFNGSIPANQVFKRWPSDRALTFATNCAGSAPPVLGLADTGGFSIGLYKNGTQFGSITFAAGATTATFTCTATSFAIGDVFTMVGPSSAPTTAQSFGGGPDALY